MSATNPKSLFRIKGSIQDYDWGKQGPASLVARLGKNAIGGDFSLDEKGYYAEVWMGTHPNGPAKLYKDPSLSLLDLIKSDPKHYLGEAVLQKWPSTLHVPFLFKILSVGKALPLQAHPDKSLGEKLNRENSEEFVDANHKPEIAVSIGEPLGEKNDGDGWGEGVAFVGFVGFRPLEEIKEYVGKVPELQRAIGNEGLVKMFLENPCKPTLKNIYSHLLTNGAHHPEHIEPEVRSLVDKIKSGSSDVLGTSDAAREVARLLVKVDQQYPGNVGVFATSFFMNFFKKKKGESVYIGADEIHAYLEGDIIECMAISDNVLNAAFVPESQSKQHVPTFLSMLTYTSRDSSHWHLPHTKYKHSKTGKTQVYDPPLEEFVVLGTHLREGDSEVLGAVGGPTIGIVTKGRVKFSVAGGEVVEVDEGGIVYVVAGNDVEADLIKGVDGIGEIWWAAAMV